MQNNTRSTETYINIPIHINITKNETKIGNIGTKVFKTTRIHGDNMSEAPRQY